MNYSFITIILIILIGYFIGSIPFALVIGKVFYNTDVRKFGSGNLGGTNTGRVLGKKAGISVIILDVLKVVIAALIAYFINPNFYILAPIAAAFGHCYPVFANFKGGKAVATFFGFLLSVTLINHNFFLFVSALLVFFIILKFSKMVSFASILTSIYVAIIFSIYYTIPYIIAGWLFAVLIIFRHRANIKRILDGSEKKITWM